MSSDRDQAEALNRRGLAFVEQGNLSEAISNFRQVLRLQPDYFEAGRNLSDAILKSKQQAVQLLPQLAQAHYELGMVHGADSPWYPSMRLFRQSRLGEWDDVFERIEQALKSAEV